MRSQITEMLYVAEERYLESEDLAKLEDLVDKLSDSITAHNSIEKSEISIFQSIANNLVRECQEIPETTIELALSHWLRVLRFCTMAMVLDSPEFLNIRLLEWVKETTKFDRHNVIESKIYEMLLEQLGQILSAEQMSKIVPFLEMASNALCADNNLQLN